VADYCERRTPPPVAQIDFEPCTKIHGQHDRDANVPKVSGGVSRGDMHCAAKCDSEVLIIPADPLALGVYFHCRFGGPRELVPECDVALDPVADGLYFRPPRRRVAKPLPGKVREPVDFAKPAGEQKLKRAGLISQNR